MFYMGRCSIYTLPVSPIGIKVLEVEREITTTFTPCFAPFFPSPNCIVEVSLLLLYYHYYHIFSKKKYTIFNCLSPIPNFFFTLFLIWKKKKHNFF
jgi:hypothetical protein